MQMRVPMLMENSSSNPILVSFTSIQLSVFIHKIRCSKILKVVVSFGQMLQSHMLKTTLQQAQKPQKSSAVKVGQWPLLKCAKRILLH